MVRRILMVFYIIYYIPYIPHTLYHIYYIPYIICHIYAIYNVITYFVVFGAPVFGLQAATVARRIRGTSAANTQLGGCCRNLPGSFKKLAGSVNSGL